MINIVKLRAALPFWGMLLSVLVAGVLLASGLLHPVVLAFAGPARASFTVNSTKDEKDATPGDGVCATAKGTCTLRAAVQEANALTGPDQILLATGVYTLTLAGSDDQAATGDLDITDPLTITGSPTGTTTIDGGGLDRIFDVFSTNLTLANVTLQNGKSSSFGGGIYNRGMLALTNISLYSNQATRGGGIYSDVGAQATISSSTFDQQTASSGGALWNNGSMDVSNSSFTGNSVRAGGGAIVNSGMLTIKSSTFTSNIAYSGAAIDQSGGSLTVEQSTLDGNTAVYGGGIVVEAKQKAALVASTLSNNIGSQGGGIFNAGTLALTNSTLSGNYTKSFGNMTILSGGGIMNNGSMTIASTTLVGNSAPNGSAVQSSGVVTFTNSIVTFQLNAASDSNCEGTIVSAGFNIDSGAACHFSQSSDMSNTNPQLGVLRFNGGATNTHALLPSSPAIDHGSINGCAATDQRGVQRPQGSRCDIGAFELELTGAMQTATAQAGTATAQASADINMPLPATATAQAATAQAIGTTQLGTVTATPAQVPAGSYKVLLPLLAK